jgi:hypothetical protein
MEYPKKSLRGLKCAAFLLLFVAPALPAAAEEQAESTISLRWALGARDAEDSQTWAVTKDTRLEKGTQLKFLVEPRTPGAVYLIFLGSSGELHVLHRDWISASGEGGSGKTYIPPGDQWFELEDPAGYETFFLIASRERLVDLDRLLDDLEAADVTKRESVSEQVVQEIRRQHKAHREFSRPIAKPVMIGGQTRGEPTSDGTSIDQFAIDVTATQFYGKTITIDH